MFFERTIAQTIEETSQTFPVLLVTGPRQVGKTTILEKLAEPERKRVSLDNPTLRALAKSDPELFLQRYSPPVLIDEVQYAPELFPHIKMLVDRRRRNGDFWLTGSQMFHMMRSVTESLAGRAGVIPMFGLSSCELDGRRRGPFEVDPEELVRRMGDAKPLGVTGVFERIFRGSMPRLHENPKVNANTYFESYVDTYVSRDIRSLSQVADEAQFIKFIQVVAARTATVLNYAALAQEAGVSAPTAKNWLSLLVSSGLVVLIPPFSNNALKRVVKSPRLYFADTGLCAHLTGWDSARVLESGAMSGEFFETWVVMEIYKSYMNAGVRPPLHFYRDSNRKEIDLVLFRNGVASPVEIKKGAAPKDAVRNFPALAPIESLEGKAKIGSGAVVCLSGDVVPIDAKNWFVPAWLI